MVPIFGDQIMLKNVTTPRRGARGEGGSWLPEQGALAGRRMPKVDARDRKACILEISEGSESVCPEPICIGKRRGE